MTTLADIDTILRLPDLTPLDRSSLLVARQRAFEGPQSKQGSATDPGSAFSPLPEDPEGDE